MRRQDKIVLVPNADKGFEHKDSLRPGIMPSHPCRIVLGGRSGCGKGVVAKNLIARASPAFERIVVYHYDTASLEWNDCDPSDMIDALPDDPGSFWDREVKNLLIMDEVPFEGMGKQEKQRVDRMFKYVASHYNVSVYLLTQNFCSIPVAVRRAADWWTLWGSVDAVSIRDVSGKIGHDFASLLRLTATKYDSITFDFSSDGPVLRLNLFRPTHDAEN